MEYILAANKESFPKPHLVITIDSVLLCYLEQEVSEGNESWSVFRFGAPALQHHIVDILRTIVWFTQPLSFHVHLVKDL